MSRRWKKNFLGSLLRVNFGAVLFTIIAFLLVLIVTLDTSVIYKHDLSHIVEFITPIAMVGGLVAAGFQSLTRFVYQDETQQMVSGHVEPEMFKSAKQLDSTEISAITGEINLPLASASQLLPLVELEVAKRISIIADEKVRAEYLIAATTQRLDQLTSNLVRQLSLQDRKATVNLFIGMAIALIGFALLGWLTLSGYMNYRQNGASADLFGFVEWYVPKLTFVMIIEIFSYFFLSLYRAGLGEIKFFQNEITNLECKWASIQFAFGAGDRDALKGAIERMALTERNFVLRKGERNASEGGDAIPASKLAEAVAQIMRALPADLKK